MNTEAFFLFIILLLGLLIIVFLGVQNKAEPFTGTFSGNFNSTDNTTGETNNQTSTNSTTNSTTNSNTNYDNYNHFSGTSSSLTNGTTFYGENGGSIVVSVKSDGTTSLKVILKSGDKVVVYKTNDNSNSNKKTFYVHNIRFYDYNASIDLFLDKSKGKLLSMKYV